MMLVATIAYADEPDIIIQGLDEAQLTNVQAFLSLTQENCQSTHWRIKMLFAESDKEITNALHALGFYQPVIDKHLTFTDDCWQAKFDITAGKPVIIKKMMVSVQGQARQEPAFNRLLSSLPLKQGDILNHGLYEKIKQNFQALALELGYFKSHFVKKEIQVNLETRQATIVLIFDSGPRHRFGAIKIDQNILNPNFIQRYIAIKTGDYYSTKKIAKTYNALAESFYFKSVEIKPEMQAIENFRVPIEINLLPKKKHNYSFGLGYDTDIGPVVSAGYKNRRINRKGHYFTLDMAYSPVLSTVEGLYMIPFAYPRHDHFSVGLGYKYEKPDTFESYSGKLSGQYQHIYPSGWKQILFLDLTYETFTISDENQNTLLLVPGIRWEYTESNNIMRPTQGYHVNFSLSTAHDVVVSDVTFVQAKAAIKHINSLPWSARLISRVNLGATLANDFDRLPPTYRFYAGGTETIRGYQYKKLGPTDDQGAVIGGKFLTVASIEYDQFINKAWGVAAFVDAGNAYNTNDFTIKIGVGLGLRWISPIGPLRLDVGVPLSGSDSSFQVHFATGSPLQ